ncbi:hypothetical protein CBOM_00004 [Ceraceosorus bombacis]|uniref:Hedgehog/Intein (Hint) domain-containing protein n=1 Tax=Ceraceosorus bombacis TaxID=401625 RepID=A0A0N7L8U9_9BASI|nr:hypothetical protein CBOM_00004 [Ceraceosorus bombacis]
MFVFNGQRELVEARNIRPGDTLLSADGESQLVTSARVVPAHEMIAFHLSLDGEPFHVEMPAKDMLLVGSMPGTRVPVEEAFAAAKRAHHEQQITSGSHTQDDGQHTTASDIGTRSNEQHAAGERRKEHEPGRSGNVIIPRVAPPSHTSGSLAQQLDDDSLGFIESDKSMYLQAIVVRNVLPTLAELGWDALHFGDTSA